MGDLYHDLAPARSELQPTIQYHLVKDSLEEPSKKITFLADMSARGGDPCLEFSKKSCPLRPGPPSQDMSAKNVSF